MKPNIIEKLAKLNSKEYSKFLNSEDAFDSIKLDENRYFHIIKSIDEDNFQPNIAFFILDKPYINFEDIYWTKGKYRSDEGEIIKVGSLWTEFNTFEDLYNKALELFGQDDVMRVFTRKIFNKKDELPTISLIIMKKEK